MKQEDAIQQICGNEDSIMCSCGAKMPMEAEEWEYHNFKKKLPDGWIHIVYTPHDNPVKSHAYFCPRCAAQFTDFLG